MGWVRSLWYLLPRPVREFPADLAVIVAIVVTANVAVFAPSIRDTPLRVPFGLAIMVFAPGYALIATLFPENGASRAAADEARESDGVPAAKASESPEVPEDGRKRLSNWPPRSAIDGLERVLLSVGASTALVPLFGLALNVTPWGIRLGSVVLSVSAFTLGMAIVAAVRRWDTPSDERFRLPYRSWCATGRDAVIEPTPRTDTALNVLLAASLLLAVGTVGYVMVVPSPDDRFSAIYLLTETDEGELVADGYPTEFTAGESAELVVGVDNSEYRTVDYTIVVVEQDVETVDGEIVVEEQRELDRIELRMAHDESRHHRYTLEPSMTGENVRIVWLLYPNDVPSDPSTDTTDYYATLWVTVTED